MKWREKFYKDLLQIEGSRLGMDKWCVSFHICFEMFGLEGWQCHNDTVTCECKISIGTREIPKKSEVTVEANIEVFNTTKTNGAFLCEFIDFHLTYDRFCDILDEMATKLPLALHLFSHTIFFFILPPEQSKSNNQIRTWCLRRNPTYSRTNIEKMRRKKRENIDNDKYLLLSYSVNIHLNRIETEGTIFRVFDRCSCFRYFWALTTVIIILYTWVKVNWCAVKYAVK